MNIALLIPAFNEAPNLEPLFQAIAKVPEPVFAAVVLVDNGSTDGTGEIAQRCGATVLTETRRGYGAACLCGLEWLRQHEPEVEAVLFLDADLSDDPMACVDVMAPILTFEADLVIGSRVQQAEVGALNIVQRIGNQIACRLIYWTTGKRYSDLGPMRCITWRALQKIDMQDQTWGWTVEMQMKAALRGVRVQEVSVPYRRRHAGRSKISGTISGVVRAGYKIITTILVLWWKNRSGSVSRSTK